MRDISRDLPSLAWSLALFRAIDRVRLRTKACQLREIFFGFHDAYCGKQWYICFTWHAYPNLCQWHASAPWDSAPLEKTKP